MLAITLLTLAVSGCGRYADFRLPAPSGGGDVRFEWTVRPQPVLGRGPEAWDTADALNPSVVEFHGRYLNLYSGFDGQTWHTGVARSADLSQWEKLGRVISPDAETWEGHYIAANGAAIAREHKLWYWYQAGTPPQIGMATSTDGRSWTKQNSPVLSLGPVGSWDERGVGDPYVIDSGPELFLFYVGMDRARRQRLGVARSRDGVRWTKLRTNPILEIGPDESFDGNGLGEPAVWASHGRYWMLYTGRDRREFRRIGLAESDDGVRWHRSDKAPVFEGGQAWNNKVVCDPSVLPASDGVHVWFGGGDQARPDERLNGQIGYAFLRAVSQK
jgi:predicted GH43/DUF377 family glycosyl hydrolase